MTDNEGSVFTEDSDIDESEETEASGESEGTGETEGETSETGDEAKAESTDGSLKTQEQEKAELTEKGTKLDDNPLSRVNQELANERAKIKKYEEVLNNPALLKGYVKQFEKPGETQEEKKPEEPEIRVEDIQTTEDLQKYQRQQDRKLDAKLKELDSTITSVKTTQKDTEVAGRITNDIATVREKYQELDPKSSTYNRELDLAVGELYEKFDLDPETKTFKGNTSIKEIADIVMRAHGSSKKQGSDEAQTTVRDKRTGKVTTGASNTAPDESGMSAGQLIASRIKAARGGR